MSETKQEHENIPVHVAIIPDGNRRWARQHGLPPLEGHRRGVDNLDKLITKARELGIKYFTGWAFSSENWKRTQEETGYLFDLLRGYIKRCKEKFLKEKIRLIHLGRKDRIPRDIAELIADIEKETKDFTDFTVAVGLDYGGQDEIIRAVNKVIEKGLRVTSETIEESLDTKGMPMPDLIIRPGGEQRLSGFLLWQCAYAEFYFPKIYFPDFGPKELEKAVLDFSGRERRFGGDSKQPSN